MRLAAISSFRSRPRSGSAGMFECWGRPKVMQVGLKILDPKSTTIQRSRHGARSRESSGAEGSEGLGFTLIEIADAPPLARPPRNLL